MVGRLLGVLLSRGASSGSICAAPGVIRRLGRRRRRFWAFWGWSRPLRGWSAGLCRK